jgi:hypothetical protein
MIVIVKKEFIAKHVYFLKIDDNKKDKILKNATMSNLECNVCLQLQSNLFLNHYFEKTNVFL